MAAPLKLLLLEDRPADAELLLFELRDAGYDPDWQRVDSEADYLAAIEQKPEVILADFSLPQFTALRALHLLQERQLDIPFIVVTGTISEEVAVDCMKQGATDYLLKDRLSRLGQAIDRGLEQKRLRDEKNTSQEALRSSEVRFRSLVQNLGDIITVHNAKGFITYESPSASRILGYPPDYFIGREPLSHTHPEDRERVSKFISSLARGESGDPAIEYRFRHATGHWIYLESAATNLLGTHEVDGIVLTSRDVTERKHSEEELHEAHLELADAYDATIEGWSRALDLRDKETEGHTKRVTEMTIILARALGVYGEDLVQIRRGALLHDIGKMGIPDHILLKPGPLTTEEWKTMRRHPEYAYEMLYPVVYLRPALDIPISHHERWDGTGYPKGLKGEEIPIAARIFSVVDVWDALCSDRPYRKGSELTDVINYIKEHSGIFFDPRIVDVFIDLLKKGEFGGRINGYHSNLAIP
jgi:PAS domain S-box-containing protein/putative nucleotidyltransferase with HDIG domain